MKGIRKVGSAAIISFTLFTQIYANLPESSLSRTSDKNNRISSWCLQAVEQPIWRIKYLSWFLGLNTKWRMFSPPDLRNWEFLYYGVNDHGLTEQILRPTQEKRNFWQRNFIDFREAKFELNIYANSTQQNYFAQHLCSIALRDGKHYSDIEMFLESAEFTDLNKAKQSNAKIGPRVRTYWGKFRCLPLLPVS